MSSSPSGCSMSRRSYSSIARKTSACSRVNAELASTCRRMAPNARRTSRTTWTSHPGLILILIRRYHRRRKSVIRASNASTDGSMPRLTPASIAGRVPPQRLRQRDLTLLAVQIPQRRFHSGFCHVMAAEVLDQRREILWVGDLPTEQQRQDEALQDVPCGAGRLFVI